MWLKFHARFRLSPLQAAGPPHVGLSAFGHHLMEGEVIPRPNNRTVDLSISSFDAMNAQLNVECTRQTNDGPYYDQGCIFPFIYRGETYDDCTTVDDGRAWCSVQVNENNEHTTGSPLSLCFCPWH